MNLEDSLKRRLSSILEEVERRGFEAVVFLSEVIGQNPSNFVYVSGPWGLGDEHNTLVFDVDGGSTLVFPHWGAKRMEETGLYDRVISIKQEKGHHIRATKEALAKYDPEKVCFDLSTLSAQFALALAGALGVKLDGAVDVSDHVFKMRAIKDEYEIGEMKEAIRITEEAVKEMVAASKPGVHAWDLKKRLDAAMIEKGAIEFSFWSSVGFGNGPRRPARVVKHGDVLLTDVGCRVPSGYCSDMGRTWPMTPTPKSETTWTGWSRPTPRASRTSGPARPGTRSSGGPARSTGSTGWSPWSAAAIRSASTSTTTPCPSPQASGPSRPTTSR
jgi:Xaa-Pro aminopeptidase